MSERVHKINRNLKLIWPWRMTKLAILNWRPFWVPSIHFCLNTISGPHNVGKGGVGAAGFYKVKMRAAIKHPTMHKKASFPSEELSGPKYQCC